jgi:chaperonin cofactor prefoldin
MALQTTYFIYTAKNNSTGLTDVTAKVRRNGAYVLGTDITPLTLTELDGGRYQLALSPAQLTTAGGAGLYDVYIDSASKPAPATAGKEVEVNDNDDLDSHLDTIETKIDTIDTEVGAIQTDITSIKSTVEDTNADINDGTTGLPNIKALIDALQSSVNNISNVTRFSAPLPKPMVRLDTGTKRYQIPVHLYDTNGNMEDPDSNQIQLLITDEAGNSRDSFTVGFTVQPHYITRNGAGDYQFELDIPDTADLEQLKFKFVYVEGGITLTQHAVTELVAEAQTSGTALESTSQTILTDTADMQPRVADIQSKVNDATFGLSALKTLLDTIAGYTDSIEGELANGTYGLSALQTLISTKASQSSVTAITTNLDDNVKGTGFSNTTDSLKAISDRVYTGGKAI